MILEYAESDKFYKPKGWHFCLIYRLSKNSSRGSEIAFLLGQTLQCFDISMFKLTVCLNGNQAIFARNFILWHTLKNFECKIDFSPRNVRKNERALDRMLKLFMEILSIYSTWLSYQHKLQNKRLSI